MANEWHPSALTKGRDGYADWNFGDGREFYPVLDTMFAGDPWFHIVFQLSEKTSPREFANGFGIKDWKTIVRVQPFITKPAAGLNDTKYVAALVTENFFVSLADPKNTALQKAILQLIMGLPLGRPFEDMEPLRPCKIQKSKPSTTAACDPESSARKQKDEAASNKIVVIGIIDDGIAFGHERFRSKDNKTRVEYAWIQDGECCDQDGTCETGKSPVTYGCEFRKGGPNDALNIDRLLEECTSNGSVDEEKFYRRTGLTDHSRSGHKSVAFRASHGTRVMDLACGYDPEDDQQDRPIVCVQLPTLATADTSGAGLQPNVLDGIWYILDRADKIACSHGMNNLPVVINFSYGMIAGPHDGTAPLEAAIDDILESRRRETKMPHDIVLPSGNSHLSRCHAQVSFSSEEPTKTLNWHVLPDDRTSSFMEIWLPHSASAPTASRIEVSIKPPWGGASGPLGEKGSVDGFKWMPFKGKKALCKITYEYVGPPTNRGRFVIALPPTTFHKTGNELAPPGIWTVTLTNQSLGPEEKVEAWIQRGDTPVGFFSRGRQSFFDEPCYERFDPVTGREIEDDDEQPACHIKRAGLISPIATGKQTVVMGGYLGKEMKPADYSAGGPVMPPRNNGQVSIDGPDAVTVSDDSRVHRGVLTAGTRSGSVVTLTGTSAAAPQITRFLAAKIAEYATKKVKYPGGRAIVRQAACHPPDSKSQRVGHGFISADQVLESDQIQTKRKHPPRYWDD